MKKYRYSLLAYIFNGYEQLHEVGEMDPECEYVLVTDDPTLKSNTWNIVIDPALEGLSTFDKCYAVRFNVFKYCHTDICIYLDANIVINRSLKKLIDIFTGGDYEMALMPHVMRDDFVSEYEAWVRLRNYPVENARKFLQFCRMSNYDFNYRGLYQGNFKIVRNDKVNRDFEALSLAFLKYLGEDGVIERLDQTVFTYVLNYYFSWIRVLPVSEQLMVSDYLTLCRHNSSSPCYNRLYDLNVPDVKYLFNRKVGCIYLQTCDDAAMAEKIIGSVPRPTHSADYRLLQDPNDGITIHVP